MLRNADVSYSSITPNQRNNDDSTCLCCSCACHCPIKSCCKNCFLRLPYGTITSTFFAVCGLVISLISILHTTNITDRFTHDLLRRKYYWLNDLKVWYIVFAVFVSIIIVINLLIGFATTGNGGGQSKRNQGSCGMCGCTRASTTTFIIKCVLVVNYFLFYFLLTLSFVVFTTLFICYMLTNLCNEGTRVLIIPNQEWPYPTDTRLGESSQYLDLRQFSPLLSLRSNETEFMYFKNDRLKKLCGDYVSALMFYTIICSVGMACLCFGFINYLINLSVNWVRTATKQKYAEIMYLNGAEMTAFGDGSDPNSRY